MRRLNDLLTGLLTERLIPHLHELYSPHLAHHFTQLFVIMALLDLLITPYTLLAIPILYYVLPYLRNWSIRDIPGPLPAKFSNLWLLLQARRGKRFLSVDAAHKKYGKLVRIQPNHVSIADDAAIPQIYGHGTGFLKSFVTVYSPHSRSRS